MGLEIRVGDTVQVRKYEKAPAHWDKSGIMMSMRGQTFRVKLAGESDLVYILEEPGHWLFRKQDLILIARAHTPLSQRNPNYAFKLKKKQKK